MYIALFSLILYYSIGIQILDILIRYININIDDKYLLYLEKIK